MSDFKKLITSEGRMGKAIGVVLLWVLPPFMALLLVAKATGLSAPAALDHAQLARNLAAGNGFVTSNIRPLSLVFKAQYAAHPDFYNAPAYPVVLSWAYRLASASQPKGVTSAKDTAKQPASVDFERVTAQVGAALWLISVWLTYLVGRKWFSRGAAGLATVLYGSSVAAINASIQGLVYPLLASAVLLAFWGTVPDGRGEDDESPTWRFALVGLACAVAVLTHYLMVMLALALAIYIVATQRQKWVKLTLFVLGFLAPLAPWLLRNDRLADSPLFSLYWYELVAGTWRFPGESLWRSLTPPPSLILYPFQNPREMVHKVVVGLSQYRGGILGNVDPLVGALFLAALCGGVEAGRRRKLLWLVSSSLAALLLSSCLLKAEPGLLLVWLPLLAIFGAGFFVSWVRSLEWRLKFKIIKYGKPDFSKARGDQVVKTFETKPVTLSTKWSRVLASTAAVILVLFPLVYFLRVIPAAPGRGHALDQLAANVAKGAVVMTDQPLQVAWRTRCIAIGVCQREEALDEMERVCGPLDAMCLGAEVLTQIPVNERGNWWPWGSSPRGVYRGFVPVDRLSVDAVLRIRPKRKQVKE